MAAAAAATALAGSVFGVIVLLASEWVEVGSGLAEISMRADTWGNRLLALLIQVREVLKEGGGRGEGGYPKQNQRERERERENGVQSW